MNSTIENHLEKKIIFGTLKRDLRKILCVFLAIIFCFSLTFASQTKDNNLKKKKTNKAKKYKKQIPHPKPIIRKRPCG